MLQATIRHCVIATEADSPRPPLAACLRELIRFGVTDVWLLDRTQPTDLTCLLASLPNAVTIRVCPGRPLADLQQDLDTRYLHLTACDPPNVNIAALLAACAASPGQNWQVKDGPIRLLQRDTPHREMRSLALGHLRTAPAHRPALFLDRDGTINVDHGYVGTRERFDWVAGAKAAIRAATQAGWHVFVVTNQSGIARGFYDEADLAALHRWVLDEVHACGGTIDDFRFCPFHEQASVPRYRQHSDWRKPGPGMILDLIRRWQLDPSQCLLVGDQPSDAAAADAAGISSRMFGGGNLAHTVVPLLAGWT